MNKRYMGSPHIISSNCTWIDNYLEIKSLPKKLYSNNKHKAGEQYELPRVLSPWVMSLLARPWTRVTKPTSTLTLHSSSANIIHSGGNYLMPMTAKCVFQANSSLLKSSQEICFPWGCPCLSSCHCIMQWMHRMLLLMCGFLCLTLTHLVNHKTLLIQVPKHNAKSVHFSSSLLHLI